MDVPFSFVLARNGKRNVLIDCGFMNKGGGAEMATSFDIPWWISPVRLLGELGVLAEQVTTSSSRTPISTTWAASANSRRR